MLSAGKIKCLGLIGPNGAGKSTLLKMLNGLVKPDKGRITMTERGRDVSAVPRPSPAFAHAVHLAHDIFLN